MKCMNGPSIYLCRKDIMYALQMYSSDANWTLYAVEVYTTLLFNVDWLSAKMQMMNRWMWCECTLVHLLSRCISSEYIPLYQSKECICFGCTILYEMWQLFVVRVHRTAFKKLVWKDLRYTTFLIIREHHFWDYSTITTKILCAVACTVASIR